MVQSNLAYLAYLPGGSFVGTKACCFQLSEVIYVFIYHRDFP